MRINNNLIEQFKAHAAAEYPKEACGLVIQCGRKLEYVPCANAHDRPTEAFRITIDELQAARERGTVIRAVHSHPDCPIVIASAPDEAYMNESEVPMGILNWPFTEYQEYFPEAVPLLGRPFVLGVQDCWGLMMDWHAMQGVVLPDYRVDHHWWEIVGGPSLYVDNWRAAGFIEVDNPTPGDMVVMQIQADKPNHAGILLPDGHLLHHLYGQLSCREFFGSYFRDRVRLTLRHQDLKPAQEITQWV